MDGMDMLSVREFTESFGGRLSSGAVYRAIAGGRLPHIRMGRRVFIPVTALDRMLELCPVLDEKLVEEVDMIRENSHGVERVEEKKGLFGRWFG